MYKKTVRWDNINTYQTTFSKNEYDRTIDKVLIFNNLKNISQIREELNILKEQQKPKTIPYIEKRQTKILSRSKSTNNLLTLSSKFNNLPVFFSPIPFIE